MAGVLTDLVDPDSELADFEGIELVRQQLGLASPETVTAPAATTEVPPSTTMTTREQGAYDYLRHISARSNAAKVGRELDALRDFCERHEVGYGYQGTSWKDAREAVSYYCDDGASTGMSGYEFIENFLMEDLGAHTGTTCVCDPTTWGDQS